jgi:hypothetical protein
MNVYEFESDYIIHNIYALCKNIHCLPISSAFGLVCVWSDKKKKRIYMKTSTVLSLILILFLGHDKLGG